MINQNIVMNPFENNMVKITPEKEKDATEYMLSFYKKKREERVKKEQ